MNHERPNEACVKHICSDVYVETALISSHMDSNFVWWLTHGPRARPHITTHGYRGWRGRGSALKTHDISAEL